MKMNPVRWATFCGSLILTTALVAYAAAPLFDYSDIKDVITGTAAFDSYKTEKPGLFRKITVADLPQPFATESAGNPAERRAKAGRHVAASARRFQS